MNFKTYFFIFQEKAIGILIKIVLNLQIALKSITILTILIPPIYEHGMPFHLFRSSLIFFHSVL